MDFADMNTMVPVGALIAIGTLVLTVQKILKNVKKAKEEERAKILQEAKEQVASVKIELEAKIDGLEEKLKNVETSVGKDLSHLKDLHESEIKVLGEKIESLRDELKTQHVQLMTILTKLIDERN